MMRFKTIATTIILFALAGAASAHASEIGGQIFVGAPASSNGSGSGGQFGGTVVVGSSGTVGGTVVVVGGSGGGGGSIISSGGGSISLLPTIPQTTLVAVSPSTGTGIGTGYLSLGSVPTGGGTGITIPASVTEEKPGTTSLASQSDSGQIAAVAAVGSSTPLWWFLAGALVLLAGIGIGQFISRRSPIA